MTKKYLGAGVTFALTMAASAAYAQSEPAAPPAAPQATAQAPLPPGIPPNILGGGIDALGRPNFIDSRVAIAQFGEAAVRQAVTSNISSCNRIAATKITRGELDTSLAALNAEAAREPGRQRNWSIGRAILGLGQAALAFTIGNDPTYGLMVALGQAQTTGDRVEYARLMRLWMAYMHHYGQEIRQHSVIQDIYIDILGDEWCPAFMTWIERYGVTTTSVTTSYTPAAGATPAAGPESW